MLLAPSDLASSACSNVPGSVANGHGFSLLNKPLVLAGGVCPNVTSLGRFILTSPDDPAGETALGRASICTELSGVVDDSSVLVLRTIDDISFLEPGWQEVQEDDFGCGDKTTPFLILGQLKRRSRAENENNLR